MTRVPLPPVAPFYDGATVQSRSDKTFSIVDPSTGQGISTTPVGSIEDIEAAVGSARAAFDAGRWHSLPPSQRKRVLHAFADLIEREAADLDLIDAREMGKPISLGFCNAASAAGLVRFCAETIDKLNGDHLPSDAKSMVVLSRVPRGVVGAITPWNFPTFNAVLKVAPALAAGNCVVLKPSELSSGSAVRLVNLAAQAGVPPGVLNLVPGLGQTVGEALARHMDVDMITFTGSTAVGKRMLEYAGQSNMKTVMAECGGKSPHIVFDDGVDLDGAAQFIVALLTTNQGQLCSAGSRLLVQRPIHDALVALINEKLSQLRIGSAVSADVDFGPVVSAKQLDRITAYIDSAPAEGARLAYGGARILRDTGGFFVQPTVFTNVSPQARIAREEIFGSVLSVTAFDDEDEAVRLTNGTIYGLVAYVWTASLSTGLRMAKAVRSSVLVNAALPSGEGAGHALSSEPFGQSGIGAESGMAGLESYMRRQTMWFNHG